MHEKNTRNIYNKNFIFLDEFYFSSILKFVYAWNLIINIYLCNIYKKVVKKINN